MVYCFDCSRGGRKQHTKSHSDLFSHSWKCNFMITCSSLSNLYREKHTMILERLISTSSDSYSFRIRPPFHDSYWCSREPGWPKRPFPGEHLRKLSPQMQIAAFCKQNAVMFNLHEITTLSMPSHWCFSACKRSAPMPSQWSPLYEIVVPSY